MKKVLRWFWNGCQPVLLYAILLMLLSEAGNIFLGDYGTDSSLFLTGAGAILVFVLLFPVYKNEKPQFSGGNSNQKINYLALGLIGGGFCLLGNLIIGSIGIASENYRQTEAVLFAPAPGWQLLLIGLVIPAAEELVFRGMCYRRFRKNVAFWPAAVLSALLFGWFHGNIVQGAYALIGGLIMAWGYEWFHSLKAAYCIHVSSNLLSLLIRISSLGTWFGNSRFNQAAGCVLGAIFLFLGIFHMKRKCEVESDL